MVNDFEDRLKQLLNEQVDHELGGRRRTPPVTEQPHRHGRGRLRPVWLMPLLAAAAVVVAVVGGGVIAHSVASRNDFVAPATDSSSNRPPTPAPLPTLPSPTGSADPSTTPRVSSTAPPPPTSRTKPPSGSESSGPPAGTTVTLDGARIAVPDGWTAHVFSGAPGVNAWCLRARGGSNDACAVTLQHFASLPDGVDLDREGFQGDAPQYICGNQSTSATEKLSTSTFGGRPAEVREFDRSCASNGKKWRTLQYFVPTAPAWGLIVMGATSRDGDIARRIVTGSTLPDETGDVRVLDRGTIRSVSRGRSDVTITIDRTRYDNNRDRLVDVGVTARYVVSTAKYDRAGVKSGSRITLRTDGSRVTALERDLQA